MEIGEFKCEVCPRKRKWIPCSEKMPKNETEVLVTDDTEIMAVCWYSKGKFKVAWNLETFDGVVAWMPLPEVYTDEV